MPFSTLDSPFPLPHLDMRCFEVSSGNGVSTCSLNSQTSFLPCLTLIWCTGSFDGRGDACVCGLHDGTSDSSLTGPPWLNLWSPDSSFWLLNFPWQPRSINHMVWGLHVHSPGQEQMNVHLSTHLIDCCRWNLYWLDICLLKNCLGDLSEAYSVGSMYECPEIGPPRNYSGEAWKTASKALWSNARIWWEK